MGIQARRLYFSTPNSLSLAFETMLRLFFKFKRKLVGELCQAAVRALLLYFQVVAGQELEPGIVAIIQTFGDRINFHPHLHFLVTEGGVDDSGVFHKAGAFDDGRIAGLFTREVLALLARKKLLSQEWAERLLSWRQTGFSVHSRVRAGTRSEAERVGKYMIRPVLALERLSFLEKEGQVGYRYGQDSASQEVMDYWSSLPASPRISLTRGK